MLARVTIKTRPPQKKLRILSLVYATLEIECAMQLRVPSPGLRLPSAFQCIYCPVPFTAITTDVLHCDECRTEKLVLISNAFSPSLLLQSLLVNLLTSRSVLGWPKNQISELVPYVTGLAHCITFKVNCGRTGAVFNKPVNCVCENNALYQVSD